MSLVTAGQFHSREESGSFNMTPIIDIVFLLIIFFLVVCQFIEAENFPVAVPDGCEFAQSEFEPGEQVTTNCSIDRRSFGRFAVRAKGCYFAY